MPKYKFWREDTIFSNGFEIIFYPIIAIFRCVTRAINDSEKSLNSVSKIDRISRVVFPSTYLGKNEKKVGHKINIDEYR